ncbi:hypothetical protein TRIUR3_32286 [Triticum urartu]|uniref:Uncharacterized protein n=2 Tax=Triticum TaxID=4564 RepID=A0A9R0SA88_TRITD|nr:hypothetical protein TRIUR3_32286 [Triticum urartu]VAH91135.1 unnamed protein product [Triticum turgidum subsp. durum]
MVIPPTTPAGGEDAPMKVTRSIMIKRPAGYPSSPRSAASTPPASPLGSTPPISPFAGGGSGILFCRSVLEVESVYLSWVKYYDLDSDVVVDDFKKQGYLYN